MNHLWFGKSLKEATDSPVVFVDSQNELKFEPNFDKVTHRIDTRSFNRRGDEAETNQSNLNWVASKNVKCCTSYSHILNYNLWSIHWLYFVCVVFLSCVFPTVFDRGPQVNGTHTDKRLVLLQRGEFCGTGPRLHRCSLWPPETGESGWLLTTKSDRWLIITCDIRRVLDQWEDAGDDINISGDLQLLH